MYKGQLTWRIIVLIYHFFLGYFLYESPLQINVWTAHRGTWAGAVVGTSLPRFNSWKWACPSHLTTPSLHTVSWDHYIDFSLLSNEVHLICIWFIWFLRQSMSNLCSRKKIALSVPIWEDNFKYIKLILMHFKYLK